MSPPRVRCPTCQRELAWSDEFPWKPFCSERCRMVDLGAWFAEDRRIADEEGGGEAFENSPPDN